MDLEEVARKYALENAVEYGGECNPSAVIGKVINETGEEPSTVGKIAGKVCGQVNQMTLEEQKEEMENYEYEEKEHVHDPLPDLHEAEEGEVVVRFAPNPNGPPHMGSARGMVINGELKEKYNGELALRFDDTDPRNKRPLPEAYEMYQEDYEWLGYDVDTVVYSSKQFDNYIEKAEKLIEMNKAYVCECPPEKARKLRAEGEACEHRDQSVEDNSEKWSIMREGCLDEGDAVLKIKTDIEHKNPAMRDFVAFRIIEDADHPITGDKYRVWPLLDFAGAIEDHTIGTTHIVRGKDLRASTERQKYIYNYLDWDYPEVRYWGKITISGFDAPMSTSTLGEMIEEDELEGWDDPRAPTVSALRRRGFQPEAIREFFIDMGVTENEIEASVETLESHNRDVIDDEANRYFFVRDPVEIEIENLPEDVKAEMPLHPNFEDRGMRTPEVARNGSVKLVIEENDVEDGLLRLKGLCNIELDGKTAEYVEGDHTVAVEKDVPIIHWVPADSPEANVKMPDGTKREGKLETSEIDIEEVVQFERFGFVRKDSEREYYYTHK